MGLFALANGGAVRFVEGVRGFGTLAISNGTLTVEGACSGDQSVLAACAGATLKLVGDQTLGGISAGPEAAVFRRGVEFSAFSTCIQSHGFVRNAYDFDAATQAHYRKYMAIHAALSNVVAKLNRRAAATGEPPVRPLVYRYPEDPKTWDVFDEFLLGDALLVAPVFSEKSRGDVYLPVGDWQRLPGLEIPVYVDRSHPDAADFAGLSLARGLSPCG